MEPVELLGIAGVATAGWALGRWSRSREPGRTPGDAIADAGARASRGVAFGVAGVGARALMYGAAATSAAGALTSRGVGTTADVIVGATDAVMHGARRMTGRRDLAPMSASHDPETQQREPAADVGAGERETESGIVLPADVNSPV